MSNEQIDLIGGNPTIFMMVGLPYSGKSTFLKSQRVLKSLPIASTDEYLEQLAKRTGKSYGEVIKTEFKTAKKHMNAEIAGWLKSKQSFVWDQTNLTKVSRRRVIDLAKANGFKVYVIEFAPFPNEKALMKRVEQRKDKVVPLKVLNDMKARFEAPSFKEGYDKFVYINTWI